MIDQQKIMETAADIAAEGYPVKLNIVGSSMAPFLGHMRDSVTVKKIENDPVKGDIILYRRADGRYIMHRVVDVDENNHYSMCGDEQSVIEYPIYREQMIAIACEAVRKGKKITADSFIWKFYRNIWIKTIKIRPFIFYIRKLLKRN